ncbi:stefin-C-like [Plectropomus leopardus]|uniref:stefin-C-like n=1 Tax=Plectropomus leopardus TaxID=160734 RepID=UPI001C4BA898|nr:stefin-C-like [Plectropomus leopardus]
MAAEFGEWSKTLDATADIQMLCDQVKKEVEKITGQDYKVFKAVKYRIKSLCGGQFFVIKVDVGADYDHLNVHQITGLQHEVPPTLHGVEQHKTKEDPLVPFSI